jgi:molybdopterin molybdotransferase
MDGFAFATEGKEPRPVVGSVAPEDDPPSIERGEAVAVATGAPLPPTADAVWRREDAAVTDDGVSGPPTSPGTNVQPAGTTATSGERLFEAGRRLAPRHVSLLRDVGIDAVSVREPLAVGLVPTGTEIHEGRQPDRDSEMLANLLRRWGHRPTVEDPLRDDVDEVREGIESAADRFDAVVTTGGTSVGGGDHVVSVLREHDVLFRGVALRPGRPVTAATVDETPVIALPGKPIAAHTAATLVVRPFFAGPSHRSTTDATVAADLRLPDDDVEFAVPVTLEGGRATPLGHADSTVPLYGDRFAPGRVASCTRVSLADGVVLTRTALEAGEDVSVVPYGVIE